MKSKKTDLILQGASQVCWEDRQREGSHETALSTIPQLADCPG